MLARLTIGDGAITRTDLMHEPGKDAIVDFSALQCSSAASLFCGTGGCTLALLTADERKDVLAKDWRLVTFGEGDTAHTALVLSVHGSECGGDNTRRCFRALTWADGAWQERD